LATILRNGDQLLGIGYHFKIFRSQVATRKKVNFPPCMHGHKSFKTLFQRCIKIRGFNQKKIVANHKISFFILAKKKQNKIGVTAVHVL